MTNPSNGDPWVVFDYEADTFFGLCELLADGNPEYAALPHHVRNAVVESALVHARQLIDILLSRGNHPNDIKLNSLPGLTGFTPRRKSELEALYGNRNTPGCLCEILNTRLAHATTQRSNSYDYSTRLNQLHPMLQEIVQEVRQQRK